MFLSKKTKRDEKECYICSDLLKLSKNGLHLITSDKNDIFSDISEMLTVRQNSAIGTIGSDCIKETKVCPICFEEIKQIGITECNHEFCFQCLYNWTIKEEKCPICRKIIRLINYFRRRSRLSLEINKRTYDRCCYICKKIKKIDCVNGEKLTRCTCGMYFHLKCDINTIFRKITLKGYSQCFECAILEKEMSSIDKINDSLIEEESQTSKKNWEWNSLIRI